MKLLKVQGYDIKPESLQYVSDIKEAMDPKGKVDLGQKMYFLEVGVIGSRIQFANPDLKELEKIRKTIKTAIEKT